MAFEMHPRSTIRICGQALFGLLRATTAVLSDVPSPLNRLRQSSKIISKANEHVLASFT